MKKLFYLMLSAALSLVMVNAPTVSANAQEAVTKRIISTDTTANADTSYSAFTVPNDLYSIHVDVKKTSGTVAGKVFLWRSNNNSSWELADSSGSLADQTTNTKIFTYTTPFPTAFARVELRTTGTQGSLLQIWHTRRVPTKPQ